ARRDSVVALFWPELDTAHARGALRQSLRFLRRELGDGILNGHSDEAIEFEPATVWCDVVAFEEACKAGQAGHALQLYRGGFLAACSGSTTRRHRPKPTHASRRFEHARPRLPMPRPPPDRSRRLLFRRDVALGHGCYGPWSPVQSRPLRSGRWWPRDRTEPRSRCLASVMPRGTRRSRISPTGWRRA